jgi:hypothetical protein
MKHRGLHISLKTFYRGLEGIHRDTKRLGSRLAVVKRRFIQVAARGQIGLTAGTDTFPETT